MAYKLRVYCDVDWIPAGTGQAFNAAANIPGMGAGLSPGEMGCAQTYRLQQGEPVQAVNPAQPTAAEFHTAVTQAATDLNTQMTAALVAYFQGWNSGLP
jgi:hypothetical protein